MQSQSGSISAPIRHERRANARAERARAAALLRTAIEEQSWTTALTIIERHWGRFVIWEPEVLDEALRALPVTAIHSRPIVVAVRELRLRVRNDVEDAEMPSFESALPTDTAGLERLARAGSARFALSAATVFMVVYRMLGRLPQALRFANIAEEAARAALRFDPDDTAGRVPSAYLQMGITRLHGGDLIGARLALKEAYDAHHDDDDPLLGFDAASKLALLHALQGETRTSRQWLERFEATPLPVDPIDGIQVAANVARLLLSVDAGDPPPPEEQRRIVSEAQAYRLGWGGYLALGQALTALHRGNPFAARQVIDLHRRRVPGRTLSPYARSYLDATRGDIFMVLGQGTRAHQALKTAGRAAPVIASRARLHLLAQEDASALSLARAVLHQGSPDTRVQIDATFTAALANERLGERDEAQALTTLALSMLDFSGALSSCALHPRAELRALVAPLETSSEPAGRVLRYLDTTAAPAAPPLEIVRLTSAEHRVLSLLAAGRTRSQIAASLFLSMNTVKSQLRSLYLKLDAETSVDALRNAQVLGFLPDDDGA